MQDEAIKGASVNRRQRPGPGRCCLEVRSWEAGPEVLDGNRAGRVDREACVHQAAERTTSQYQQATWMPREARVRAELMQERREQSRLAGAPSTFSVTLKGAQAPLWPFAICPAQKDSSDQ